MKIKFLNINVDFRSTYNFFFKRLCVIKKHCFRFMTDFCKKRGLQRNMVSFMYNDREIFESDTPNSICMKEGDNIDCFDK